MRYLVCCSLLLLAACASNRSAQSAFREEHGNCYFQAANIGACSSLSVAPSGKHAVFLDSRTDLIYLFSVATGSSEPVSPTFKGPVLSVVWHADPPGVDISAGPANSAVTISVYFPDGSHHFIRSGT